MSEQKPDKLEESVQTRRMERTLRIRMPAIYDTKGESMRKTREAQRPLLRCDWARSEPMIRYHDEEWGVPVHDDRTLFEFLILEGAQAGLSWVTILTKRERYRAAFDQFDAATIAGYGSDKVALLLADPGIV